MKDTFWKGEEEALGQDTSNCILTERRKGEREREEEEYDNM